MHERQSRSNRKMIQLQEPILSAKIKFSSKFCNFNCGNCWCMVRGHMDKVIHSWQWQSTWDITSS